MRVTREQANQNRKRVVETAGELFREHGFDGIGVADLMKSVGLTHGGFYGQFGSKDDLAAEAMADTMGKAAEHWRARVAANPAGAFGAIAGYYLSRTHRDALANGCPASALGAETARQTPAVRKSFTEGTKPLLDILAETVPDGTTEERRVEALAAFSAMVGAIVLARAVDDPALSDEILAATRKKYGVRQPAG